MMWRTFILFIGLTTVFADNTRSDYDALKALLPLLGDSAQPQPKIRVEQPYRNFLPQSNEPQDSFNAKLQNILQQIKPTGYKPYEAPLNNNNPSDRCPNSYYSVETLLPILSMFLEILAHSAQLNKAQTAIELLKKYLDLAPPSQEKLNFLQKLKNVEENLTAHEENDGDESTFRPTHVRKTTIVFDKELPGVDQQNCRETFGRLIQTAVNVYKETAKHPQCQPNSFINENLYYPSNYVKPEKPYQFIVVYQNPPSSLYTPDYSGMSILPNLNVNLPNVDNMYSNSFLDKQPLPYQPSSALNLNNPAAAVTVPKPEKEAPYFDVIALIRQYNQLHPESPKNEQFYLELFRNLTGSPSHDHSPIQTTNPYNNPSNIEGNLFQSAAQGPVNSASHLFSFGPFNLPVSNNAQLQNYPSTSVSNLQVAQHPPNNGASPGALFMKPIDHLYGEHNPANGVIKLTEPESQPELTLEILLSILGNPGGPRTQIHLTPQILNQLARYLRPNSPERKILQMQSLNLLPNDKQQYVAYGTDGGTSQQGILNILNPQPDSQRPTFSGDQKSDGEALIRKLQQLLGVTDGNKLTTLQNNNPIELTYVLKRPKPLIYHPIYYVKYRLPFQTFVQNYQNLIMKKQDVRSDPVNLYEELLSVSNISDVSPSLKTLDKEEILKLVFGNGTLIDARVVDVPDKNLDDELNETRKMNAEVDPKVIEELNGNLGVNVSESKSNSGPAPPLPWRAPPQATVRRAKDLTVNGFTKPQIVQARFPETKANPANVVSSANSNQDADSNQVLSLPSGSAKPRQPLNVVPPTKTSANNKNPKVSNDVET